jgi:ankyrin repeat protein
MNLVIKLIDRKLIDAVELNNLNEVKLLIRKGADIECRNPDGSTPLYLALVYGYDDIFKYLLTMNANVNVTNNQGRSPLSIARERSNIDAVNALINAGATRGGRKRNKKSKKRRKTIRKKRKSLKK